MQRFLKAYDIAKELLREFDVFPKKGNAEQERIALEIDEFERGYPRLTLPLLIDVVASAGRLAEGGSKEKGDGEATALPVKTPYLATPQGQRSLRGKLMAGSRPDHAISWRALLGRLGRLHRLRVFDVADTGTGALNYKPLLQPGMVSVLDLSDSGVSDLNNLVIADLLRGVQDAQEEAFFEYERARKSGQSVPPPKVLVVIEEAHEFLSEERIEKMKILFEQVGADRKARPKTLARAGVRDAVAAAPAATDVRPGELLHPAQDHGRAGGRQPAADGERHRCRSLGPLARPGTRAGDRVISAHGSPAPCVHRSFPRRAKAGRLRRGRTGSCRPW